MALGVSFLMLLLGAADLVAPVPKGPTVVVAPDNAPPLKAPLTIQATLLVDDKGQVTRVELIGGPQGVWGQAVLLAATAFEFEPARANGVNVPSGIAFSQEFFPAARAATPAVDSEPTARLQILLMEKGTGQPLPHGAVRVKSAGSLVQAESDDSGVAKLQVPVGFCKVTALVPGFGVFRVREELRADEVLKVRYFLERDRQHTYESVVSGKRDRVEIDRTTLSGSELTQVPGTFGDPFRVITTLPGVSTLFSLLGYPIVRGTSPGSTGFLIDGVMVPELFHLLAGPSVLHPEFIDRVDFYPGTFPAEYGGYIGGIVDGITRRPLASEKRIDIDADLLQSGLFIRTGLAGGYVGTVAGRYGYPGLLLAAFGAPVGLSYWDYQARIDGPLGGGHLKAFVFGAYDALSTKQNDVLTLDYGSQFHRLDVAWSSEGSVLAQSYQLVLGVDETLLGGATSDLRSLSAMPRARFRINIAESLKLRAGVDGAVSTYAGTATLGAGDGAAQINSVGGFLDAPWWVGSDFLLTPGVRADFYQSGQINQENFDPRISARYRLAALAAGDVWLKGGGGGYHQPPRLVIPLPGYEQLALSEGLSSSWQTSLGAEIPLTSAVQLEIETYFNYMGRIVFDLSLNPNPLEPAQITVGSGLGAGGALPLFLGSLLTPQIGRSYGIEVLLRHRNAGNFFGWLSYTLSRSDRLIEGTWYPFDFDRTHLVQVVGGWRLPRDWQIGGRMQFESGRPESTATTYNALRSPPFYRVDLRVDKRVVYNEWMLDFYVDITNITIASEYLDETSQTISYILPTLGLRIEL